MSDRYPTRADVMAGFVMNVEVPAPAQAVWKLLGDFGAVRELNPLIVQCTVTGSGVGATRLCVACDGTRMFERLEALDDSRRFISYRILESPLPFEDFVGSICVRALGPDRCRVERAASYRPRGATRAEVQRNLRAFYEQGFQQLRARLGLPAMT